MTSWKPFQVLLILKASSTIVLKGLGYAILGNFTTDQIVIELT